MSFSDQSLTCKDCNNEFVFSAGEQEFFSQKNLINIPKRCYNCRILYRVKKKGGNPDETCSKINCAQCGQLTQVPFNPKGFKPVYCCVCYRIIKEQKS